jgi:hypothetical protein
MTGREFPTKGKLDAILEVMKRWGIVRVSLEHPVDDGDNNLETQPYMVIIRPAITDLLGETALQRLSRFKMEDPSDTDDDAGGAVDELADQGTEA